VLSVAPAILAMPALSGKIAVVTGASRGIGRATAEALAGEGAPVALTCRTQDELDQVAAEIGASGATVAGIAPHAGWPESIDALFAEVRERFGNVASVAGKRPLPGVGAYCVSKAAVLRLTAVLAAELAPDGIRVDALVPGFVKTRFSAALWENERMGEQTLQLVPQRRMAEPAELGRLALLLASPDSAFVTGATPVADGGHLVGTPGL
jgi:NAD(P)-dependent dehydrogenase (short-subunit alcohol dehydrogenase family)